MSDVNKFCPSCGAQLTEGAAFCAKCGNPVTPAAAAAGPAAGPSAAAPPYYERRRRYRNEKYEKEEKSEKHEKGRGGNIIGSVVAGSILVWLGITFYLEQIGAILSENWWALFLLGIGVILIIQGLLRYAMTRRPFVGSFIGGAILLVIGLTFFYNAGASFWPLIFVVIGIAIVASALTARRRTPAPA